MRKFCDCNIIKVLYEVMRHHTEYYQSDFEIDKKIFWETALSQDMDKGLLWMCKPSGTHCLSETDAYIKGTHAHNSWMFYGEQTSDPIIAYAVEIKDIVGDEIIGDLYELRYGRHFKEVKAKALPAESIVLTYSDGGKKTMPYTPNWGSQISYDNLDSARILPADLEQTEKMVEEIRKERRESSSYCLWDPDNFCYAGNSGGSEM